MNDNEITGTGPAKAAEETTSNPPTGNNGGGWSMPDPVFRQTSGYLPKGFENQFGKVAQAVPESDDEPEFDPLITLYSPPTGQLEPIPEPPDEIAVPEPVIEPAVIAQPDVDELIIEEPQPLAVAATAKKEKSGAVKSAIAASVIFIMLGVAVIFVLLIYSFFLREYGW